MEAGQELWTMWSLKEWAQEMPYYKFFSVAMVPERRSVALADINMTDAQEMPLFKEDNKDFETSPSMGSGPSNTRPTKVSKTGSGQPSTKQAKVPIDILGAHATDKDSVDKGLEGSIAVRVRWSTRAIVKLAPHSERLECLEAEGPVSPLLFTDCANSAPPPRWPSAVGIHRRAYRAAAVLTAVSHAGIWQGTPHATPNGGRAW
ncbi:hypothetical protein C0991_009965 [Blastosporella zonata]|nr:hypothetical protein C0991_009965 [Blastosporella zonata]